MALSVQSFILRSPTRLRILFSATLTSGGTDVGRYSVASVDGTGVTPTVLEALPVPGAGDGIELALSERLTDGALYALTIQSGVAAGPDVLPTTTLEVLTSTPSPAPSDTITPRDILAELFGEDLRWTGDDWAETPEGDLDLNKGPDNAQAAILRRAESDGLLWDPNYGGKPRSFVDGPEGDLPRLVAGLEQQATLDDRVVSVEGTLLGPSNADPAVQLIELHFDLVGGLTGSVQTSVRSG